MMYAIMSTAYFLGRKIQTYLYLYGMNVENNNKNS